MLFPAFLLYGGPDTIMPVASTLAAIGGLLLLLWRQAGLLLRRCLHTLRNRAPQISNNHPSTLRRAGNRPRSS